MRMRLWNVFSSMKTTDNGISSFSGVLHCSKPHIIDHSTVFFKKLLMGFYHRLLHVKPEFGPREEHIC